MSAKTLEIPIRIEITDAVIRKIKGLAAITGKDASNIEDEIVNALTERIAVKSEDIEAVLNAKIGLTIGSDGVPTDLGVAESVSKILEDVDGLVEATESMDEVMDPPIKGAQEPEQDKLIFDDMLEEQETVEKEVEDYDEGFEDELDDEIGSDYKDPIMADAQKLAQKDSGSGGGGAIVSDVYEGDAGYETKDTGPLPGDFGMDGVSGEKHSNSMNFFNQMMSGQRGRSF